MKLRVLPEAEREIEEAMQYYEDRRSGLGADFLAAIRNAMKQIERAPFRFPIYEGRRLTREFRRVLVTRFPYIVVYEARPDEIVVAAVAHTSREPGYWERQQ